MSQISILGQLRFIKEMHGWVANAGQIYSTLHWLLVQGRQEEAGKYVQSLKTLLGSQHVYLQFPPQDDKLRESDLVKAINDVWRNWDDSKVMCFHIGTLFSLVSNWRRWPDNPTMTASIEQRVLRQKQIMQTRAGLLQINLDRLISLMKTWEAGGSIIDFLVWQRRPVMILLSLADAKGDYKSRSDKEIELLNKIAKETYCPVDIVTTYLRDWQLHTLQSSLLTFKPRIIHFSSLESDDTLVLQDTMGNAREIKAEPMANLLRLAIRDGLDTVVFHSCYSAENVKPIAEVVDNVIIMRGAFGDPASMAFTKSFYAALGAGKSCAEAFEWGHAAAQFEPSADTLDAVLVQKPKSTLSNRQIDQGSEVASPLVKQEMKD